MDESQKHVEQKTCQKSDSSYIDCRTAELNNTCVYMKE